jgi:predicted CXXCH cytochrome family protein
MRSLRLLPLILLPALGLAASPAKPKAAAKAPRFERQMTPYAPPVIPHPVEKGAACTACHDAAGAAAPALPHRMIPNCQACHVEQAAAKPFKGNAYRVEGERPGPNRARYSGAPPAIPHHTLMREVCTACHGKTPRHGAKNPHPDRPACTSCHLPSGAGQ